MITGGQEGGIAKNIKIIEWLKADLLTSLAALFKSMLRGSEELILDALASLVITCYILGRRLGISFPRLDLKIEAKLRQGIDENHEVERWYGDISNLLNYLVDKKR
ncbi:MazG-like family protein [Pelotomaculum terephthalicicum JT]|uniref:MazG-like family protein n=1 Tax=Pelotomaculum TaxID=191373 RepID=UPI0009CFD9D4|nr:MULTISPECIES: MazG-like family protein [Pelotomaculum]MCG9969012.1 MazG-like family protein [Pelotomaculum terephthalicicum JT]OPX91384.1 MAG: MazG-like family protein [Pelotomaculum sp. PtaB.Bin117]OPY59379.1 MAG: MazG-like family protein [Pelotomaculum sp. PtaU1.Bin065]